jgi:hypothetical protein
MSIGDAGPKEVPFWLWRSWQFIWFTNSSLLHRNDEADKKPSKPSTFESIDSGIKSA